MQFIRGLFTIAVVIAVIAWWNGAFKTQQPPLPAETQPAAHLESAAQHTAAPEPEIVAPSLERVLVQLVTAFASRYGSAPNQMAQGALRPERAHAICRLLYAAPVRDWIGRVETLSANNEGKGVLVVRIAETVTVGTRNNALSDSFDNTLIPVGSLVQQEAMALREGQLVAFSGTFVPDQSDCLKESSLTVHGAMTAPDFVFRFSAVRPAP